MKDINVFQILSYGVIGLGFLLAFLAYRLLAKAQDKEMPNPHILRSIHAFMFFSVALCVIGVLGQFMDGKSKSSGKDLVGDENGASATQYTNTIYITNLVAAPTPSIDSKQALKESLYGTRWTSRDAIGGIKFFTLTRDGKVTFVAELNKPIPYPSEFNSWEVTGANTIMLRFGFSSPNQEVTIRATVNGDSMIGDGTTAMNGGFGWEAKRMDADNYKPFQTSNTGSPGIH